MIGVLGIIAGLAAMLLPRWIQRIDIATRTQEIANLAAIRDALQLDVVRALTVPDSSGWRQAAARWSAFSANQIPLNPRRYNRIYLGESSPAPFSLPYIQGPQGTERPGHLRALLISTLGGPQLNSGNCPNPTDGALSATDFETLWDTPDGLRPTAGNWANWSGRADDFLVQRIDYAPLFHRLVLVNRDLNPAYFNITGSTNMAVIRSVPNVAWDKYYLDGTVLGLCNTNGVAMTLYSITRDIGFVFEGGVWRAEIMGVNSSNSQADEFAAQAAAFLRAQWNPNAVQGADQQGVLTTLYSFMYTYTLWANQCPHFPYHGATAVQVPEYLMLQRIGDPNMRLEEFSGQLLRDR